MPNTMSAPAANTKGLLQDLPQLLDFAGNLWGGGSLPLSPSLQFKKSPCSRAQGDLQEHRGAVGMEGMDPLCHLSEGAMQP